MLFICMHSLGCFTIKVIMQIKQQYICDEGNFFYFCTFL